MKKIIAIFLALAIISCNTKETPTFSEKTFEQHIATLASDDFQGGLRFTEG
jgi:hypothetical protein